MLALIAILFLILAALTMLGIRLARLSMAYQWLIAVLATAIAWLAALFSRLRMPQSLALVDWQPGSIFASSPVLLVDAISWPFAAALAGLALAAILTASARLSQGNWRAWASNLFLTALGLLAVLAGNPLTLLIAWAAIDLVDVVILLLQLPESRVREQIVVSFAARAGGISLLIWAVLAAYTEGELLDFHAIPASSGLFLLLAASLRLGVLPLHLPFLSVIPMRRGLGTTLRLVPAAASLALLARTAEVGVTPHLRLPLLALTVLAAAYGSFAWLTSPDELNGRPFWILGLASLSVAGAIKGLPAASLAWGLTCVLSGGLLFLFSARSRILLPVIGLGLLGITALPFTPAWLGSQIYLIGASGWPETVISLLFLAAQVMLAAGFIRHGLRSGEPAHEMERWIWAVYPVGLLVLPVTAFVIGWWDLPELANIQLAEWLAGVLVTLFIVLVWFLRPRLPTPIRELLTAERGNWAGSSSGWVNSLWGTIVSFGWLYRIFWGIYRAIMRVIALFNQLLEGQGGVLWALVLLVLMLTILSQGIGG